jgi:hypothetical protein
MGIQIWLALWHRSRSSLLRGESGSSPALHEGDTRLHDILEKRGGGPCHVGQVSKSRTTVMGHFSNQTINPPFHEMQKGREVWLALCDAEHSVVRSYAHQLGEEP